MLELVGLADKLFERAGTLSGGQQQRASVARALYNDRSIVIGDEPVSALDRAARRGDPRQAVRASRNCDSRHARHPPRARPRRPRGGDGRGTHRARRAGALDLRRRPRPILRRMSRPVMTHAEPHTAEARLSLRNRPVPAGRRRSARSVRSCGERAQSMGRDAPPRVRSDPAGPPLHRGDERRLDGRVRRARGRDRRKHRLSARAGVRATARRPACCAHSCARCTNCFGHCC